MSDLIGQTAANNWVSPLQQLPVVVASMIVFGYFMFQLVKIFQKDASSIIEAARKDADKRDAAWRDFLREERAQRKASMEHGMESVGKMTECVERLAETLHQHDEGADQRYHTILTELREMREAENQKEG